MRDFCSLDTCVHINRPVTDKVLTTGYVLNRRILMRINSPLRLCHVCGPLMDAAHLLSVNFKKHALKGRVVDTENGISRSVENTERKRKALGRERVTATQRPIVGCGCGGVTLPSSVIDQSDQTAVEERVQFPTFDGLDLLRWTDHSLLF
ncbi:hypothetical protein YC2023_024830 [Brassica napus]